MGTSLTGKNISASYLGLIKTTDNAVIGGTAKIITDGNGNDSPLYLSTSAVGIGIASPTLKLEVSGNAEIDGINIGKGNNSITTNTAIGVNALNVNSALGNLNTAIGYSAMASNSDGEQNVAIGSEALLSNTTGDQNVAIGDDSLKANTEGESNTAIGKNSLTDNTSGDNNTAVGRLAISGNTIGLYNVGVGSQALNNNISGDKNTALGFDALTSSSSGDGNIGIGANVGSVLSSGSNNIIIGRDAEVNAGSSTNEIVIGYNVTGNGSNTVTIGNSSITANHFSGKIYFGGDLSQISNNELRFYGNSGKSISNYGIGTGWVFQVSNTTSADTDVLRFYSNGNTTIYKNLNLSSYGSGTITGTATQRLGVDSSGNVIEIPIGAGAVDGSGTANYISKWTDSDTLSDSVIYDDGTNVGIGVVPETDWNSNYKALQLNTGSAFASYASASVFGTVISTNQRTTGNTFVNDNKYIASAPAQLYLQDNSGNHIWYNAPSGTADTTITWSKSMQLDSSGNLGVGEDSIDGKLHISESGECKFDIEDTGGQDYRIFVRSSDNVFGIYDKTNPRTWFRHTSNVASASQKLALLETGGSVGIGTNSPGAKLDIHTATNTNGILIKEDTDDSITHNFYIDGSDNGVAVLYADGQSAQIQLNTAGNSYFNGGNVGIGVSPSAKLHVDGGRTWLDSNDQYTLRIGNSGTWGAYIGTPAENVLTFMNSVGSENVRIDANGNVGIGTNSITNSRVQIKGANNTTNAFADGLKVTSNNETVSTQYNWNGINGSGDLLLATGGTEHLRIGTVGHTMYLGGTTSAYQTASRATLKLQGTSSSLLEFATDTESIGYIYGASSGIDIVTTGSDVINFYTNNTYRARITSGGELLVNRNGASGYGKLNVDGGADFTGGNVLLCRDSGSVGIGTTGPDRELDVENATDNCVISAVSGTASIAGLVLGDTDDDDVGGILYNNSQNYLYFQSGASERARITSGGYFKASNSGTIPTSSAHELVSNANGGQIAQFTHSGSTPYGMQIKYSGASPNTTDNYFFLGTDSSTNRIIIWGNGNVVNSNNSYGAISDIKLKENITDASPKLDELLQVKVRNFNYIGDDKKQLGVIAQELEEIFPSMIDESPDFEEQEVPQLDENEQEVLDENGDVVMTTEKVDLGTTTKSVKYSVFVPMLIKAMQEQQDMIQELKAEIDELKKKL